MILVTGGAGFIGYNIVRRLNLMGHQNIIISDELNYKSAEINLKKLKFIDYIKPKDVFSYEFVKRCFISNSFCDLNCK